MSIPSLKTADLGRLREIRGICFDIDDTFSSHGKIRAEAFSALWRLAQAGFWCVPITGRPAGWCDHIARFWPVDAVIGENGAFAFYLAREKGRVLLRRSDTLSLPALTAEGRAEKMAALRASIHQRFPRAVWASDQPYREFDLAVDICEDVPPWPSSEVEQLLELCRDLGAHAKVSSIHVNIWFGDHDKRKGFDHLIDAGILPGLEATSEAKKLPLPRQKHEWIFAGDSPNDEPLFAHFENSVGVANLARYLPSLRSCPTWLADGEAGAGFVELADKLIVSRQGDRIG